LFSLRITNSDSDDTLLSFHLHDLGMYVDLPSGRTPNCCLPLHLAVAVDASPEHMVEHFACRSRMLREAMDLYLKYDTFRAAWDAFSSTRHLLLLSFPRPSPDAFRDWAGSYFPGLDVDIPSIAFLAPAEIRQSHLFIISAPYSNHNELRVPLQDIGHKVFYFPPIAHHQDRAPIFLRHYPGTACGHFCILHPSTNTPAEATMILAHMLPRASWFHYIDTTATDAHPFIRLLGITSPCNDLSTLEASHLTQMNCAIDSLTPSLSQAVAHVTSLEADDSDDAIDLHVDTAGPPRSPSRPSHTGEHTSPKKAPLLGTTPPRNGLGRTPRSSQSLSTHASQLTLNSEVDLGEYVEMQCRQGESTYAARVCVRGDASTDETSESGSLSRTSRSATPSQSPSMYSTGSLHEHLVPNGADIPLCKCKRSMTFVRFTQENHCCDNGSCLRSLIRKNAYGWHCSACDVDLCSNCFPYNWTPVDSFATPTDSADSISTLHISSPCCPDQCATTPASGGVPKATASSGSPQ
jgi:hypothetical protein